MSDVSFPRVDGGGAAALWTRPVRLPSWWRWPAAATLAFLTLPRGIAAPGTNPDLSWGAGLALAQEQGLHFGRDIVFTFGPLGFLVAPGLYVVWQAIAAMVFGLVLQLLFCRTLLGATHALPTAVAIAAVAIVASAPTPAAYVGLATVLVLAVRLLGRREPVPGWVAAAGGAGAAVLLLIVPTVGVEALVVSAVLVGFSRARRRAVAELVVSLLATFGGLWLATGDSAGNILPWIAGVSQLTAGYTAAMALEDPARHGDIVKGLLLAAILCALLLRSVAGLPRARQSALVAVWSVCGFGAFKEGFVRLDGHVAIFFAVSAAAALALARGRTTRFAAVAVAVVATVWSFGAIGTGIQSMFLDYPTRVNGLVANLRILAAPTERDAVITAGRRTILEPLHLPPAVLRDLRSHTVDVGPVETSVAWALGLRWRPQPVFQSYAVLTPELDRLDARFLSSSHGPERVLRVNPTLSVDGRNPVFDSPLAYLALVCNYRETFASASVEVLARSTNRCGTRRSLGGVEVAAGQRVDVPAGRANELVYAEIRIPRPLLERLRELLWKPATLPAIALDGHEFRLVAATASGPLLMQMPRSARVAASSLADSHVHSFRVLHAPAQVRIDFYAIQIRTQPPQR